MSSTRDQALKHVPGCQGASRPVEAPHASRRVTHLPRRPRRPQRPPLLPSPRSPPASSCKQRGASAGCAAHERRGGQRLANGAAARPSGTRGPLRGRGCPRPPSAMRRLSAGCVCVCGRGEWGARGARAACMLARNNRKQPVQQKRTVMPRVRDLAFAWHLFEACASALIIIMY